MAQILPIRFQEHLQVCLNKENNFLSLAVVLVMKNLSILA